MKTPAVLVAFVLAALLTNLPALAGQDYAHFRVVQTGDGAQTFEKGRVKYNHGVPFLSLSGSYYEMGLQYGVLMRKELRSSFANFAAYRKALIQGMPWYARPFTNILSRLSLWSMARRLPQGYQDELQGLADGSGLDFGDVLYCAFAPETFTIGCSTVATRRGGRLLLGRNLDYDPPSLGKFPIVIEFSPTGKRRFTSVGFVGFLGALTGFNDKGMAVSLDAVIRYRDFDSWDIPIAYKTRQILESAENLEEARTLLKGYTTTRGWALTVASALESDGSIFDLAGGNIQENPMTGDVIFVTNAFVSEAFRHKYMSALMATHPFTQIRYDMIARHLAENPVRDVDGVIDLLADVSTYQAENVICGSFMTVNNANTLQTIVIDPAAGEMVLASAPGYAGFGRFLRYAAGEPDVSVHRNEDPRYRDSIAPLFDWQERAALHLVEGDYKGLLVFTDILSPDLNLQQIIAAYQAWKARPSLVDPGALAAALGRMAERYPDFVILPIVEAEVMHAAGQTEAALALLEASLERPLNYPSTLMMAHEQSARIYHEFGNKRESAAHARECISIIKSFACGSAERLTVIQLSRFLPKPVRPKGHYGDGRPKESLP